MLSKPHSLRGMSLIDYCGIVELAVWKDVGNARLLANIPFLKLLQIAEPLNAAKYINDLLLGFMVTCIDYV